MFAPGFRLSVFDLVVLISGMGGAIFLSSKVGVAGLAVAFVVGHFFLFCNVFRISRKPELIWAVVFISLAAATMLAETPGWLVTFGGSFLLALGLIYRETKQPSYHGVGWQRLNPHLQDWWENERGLRSENQ